MEKTPKVVTAFIQVIIFILVISGLIGINFYKSKSNISVKDWSGTYEFSESTDADPAVEPNFFLGYELTLTKNENGYNASLNIDGRMTTEKIVAHGVENGDKLDIVFDYSELENEFDDSSDAFKQGDVLFILEEVEKGKLKIGWEEMIPSFENTDVNSSYFIDYSI